jgi:hypothetical protein
MSVRRMSAQPPPFFGVSPFVRGQKCRKNGPNQVELFSPKAKVGRSNRLGRANFFRAPHKFGPAPFALDQLIGAKLISAYRRGTPKWSICDAAAARRGPGLRLQSVGR